MTEWVHKLVYTIEAVGPWTIFLLAWAYTVVIGYRWYKQRGSKAIALLSYIWSVVDCEEFSNNTQLLRAAKDVDRFLGKDPGYLARLYEVKLLGCPICQVASSRCPSHGHYIVKPYRINTRPPPKPEAPPGRIIREGEDKPRNR